MNFDDIVNGITDKLGEETTSTIGDDIANLISFQSNQQDEIKKRDGEIEKLKKEVEKELQAAIEKDAALERRFQTVIVDQPSIEETIEMLKDKGAVVDYVDVKYLENAVTLYQIIAMGEASSNLARFDGIRYGYRTENYSNLRELFRNSRRAPFIRPVHTFSCNILIYYLLHHVVYFFFYG